MGLSENDGKTTQKVKVYKTAFPHHFLAILGVSPHSPQLAGAMRHAQREVQISGKAREQGC
jgi:hypothetical protein